MTTRIDSATRLIHAPRRAIWRAFAEPGAMERWLPPDGMTGRMLAFDFREGGSYRMRLTYGAADASHAKSGDDHDDAEVRLVRLVEPERIVQAVTFVSDRPEFAGVMTITWTFDDAEGATSVRVACEDVPAGIRAEDHEAALASTLENLARFVEAGG